MSELDRMLGMLHGETSPAAAPAPGLGALRELARDATALGLIVDVREAGVPGLVAPEVHAAAYRIVQEALTNAGRYGAGGAAELAVTWDDDAVEIDVRNAASGNGARGRGRHGLQGMARRAQLVGGTVAAGPEANGWRVTARLPVQRS
jgi:signal transduction histidine kinase